MTYLQIISLIFSIITGVLVGFTIYFLIFFIVGIFRKKSFPKAKIKKTYGVLISARNEETVISNLIKSIRKTNYDQSKLNIYVMAHNCTDRTAYFAEQAGATKVYSYNNLNEKTKGYAFKKLIEYLKEDGLLMSNDGYFIFDADNILKEDYFEKMNDAFCYYNGERVITSFRNSKNFGTNVMSACYGLLFISNCRYESRGRTVCDCSTRVQGTGYVINSKLVENGWPYVTLTEDWEFSADQVLKGNKIIYCDEAEFFDEQPTTFKVMWRQRVRWAKGFLLVFHTRFFKLFKRLFAKKKDKNEQINKGSVYDIMINIVPAQLLFLVLNIIQFLLLLFLPIFTQNFAIEWFVMFIQWCSYKAISYFIDVLYAGIALLLERKRIQCKNVPLKILTALVWPFFQKINIIMTVVALFSKNLQWKVIPHKDTTTFDDLNNKTLKDTKVSVVTDTDLKAKYGKVQYDINDEEKEKVA